MNEIWTTTKQIRAKTTLTSFEHGNLSGHPNTELKMWRCVKWHNEQHEAHYKSSHTHLLRKVKQLCSTSVTVVLLISEIWRSVRSEKKIFVILSFNCDDQNIRQLDTYSEHRELYSNMGMRIEYTIFLMMWLKSFRPEINKNWQPRRECQKYK